MLPVLLAYYLVELGPTKIMVLTYIHKYCSCVVQNFVAVGMGDIENCLDYCEAIYHNYCFHFIFTKKQITNMSNCFKIGKTCYDN